LADETESGPNIRCAVSQLERCACEQFREIIAGDILEEFLLKFASRIDGQCNEVIAWSPLIFSIDDVPRLCYGLSILSKPENREHLMASEI
jgi:hypothetical protein